jgi:hypothetical protein
MLGNIAFCNFESFDAFYVLSNNKSFVILTQLKQLIYNSAISKVNVIYLCNIKQG